MTPIKARQTSTTTLSASTKEALDEAYRAWRDTADEAELVATHAFALGDELVLVIVHVGGSA